MTDDLEALKAAFLARGGQVKQAEAAPAFGVDPEVDKQRRKQAKAAQRRAEREADYEGEGERAMEAYQDAYMSGAGREAAMDEYNAVRNRRRK